jgi:hypothetical protein
MKKIVLSLIAASGLAAGAFAGDFNLNSLSAADLKASQQAVEMDVPVPAEMAQVTRSPNMPAAALDMTIKLPFKVLGERVAELHLAKIQPIDPSSPILFRQGDHITFSNVSVNYNGIAIEPTIEVKPFFEGANKLAIKVMKVDADVSFGPTRSAGALDKDGLMEMVMNDLSTGMLTAMDTAFAANKVPLRARDVLAFSYDRKSWTLHAAVTPGFVAPLLPGLISNVTLANFTFDDSGFALSVKSGSASAIAQLPGYNLAMSDGLITNFIMKFSAGSAFELMPAGHYGGVKFRADGAMEVAGKAQVSALPLKPNVYFKVVMTPVLTRANTISLHFDSVTVEQAYGIGIPGFVNGWLQGTIMSNVIKVLTTDPALIKVMSVRKLDDRTVEITLKNSAFLPSFAKGAVIDSLKIGNGLMYLGFEL